MDIQEYALRNLRGMEVRVLNYGGIVSKILVPDRSGHLDDVVLGFEDLTDYLGEHPYFGCIVGRYANRIAKGLFSIGTKHFALSQNNGPNTLHGGISGFDKHFWEVEQRPSVLKLHRISLDGEEGFPGNLDVTVTYSLSEDNEFRIDYLATTNRTTVVNLTNHSYFNLNPQQGSILDHQLLIHADRYTEVDESLLPTGKLKDVAGSGFDFRQERKIGEALLSVPGGFDHNFVLNNPQEGLRPVAVLKESLSGRVMEVHTTEPGLQFYSGNFLDGTLTGKSGMNYQKHSGLCLETQHFPDSPNHPEFPSTQLRPGENFISSTTYKFYTL